MRYIGSKAAIVDQIARAIQPRRNGYASLCDPFAGTCTVARYFKALGLRVITGDVLRQSYILQSAYVQLSRPPKFRRLLAFLDQQTPHSAPNSAQSVLDYLNGLPEKNGFITQQYSPGGPGGRLFFTASNARRIDRIRHTLDHWKHSDLLDSSEEAYLLAALLEASDRVANTAGTYYAYLKTFYRKALRGLVLQPPYIFGNGRRNRANQTDAVQLVKNSQTDILYLDPPYNERDYGAYNHLTETLALGDKPQVHGTSGMPHCRPAKSPFCCRDTALTTLSQILGAARTRCLAFHYSSN